MHKWGSGCPYCKEYDDPTKMHLGKNHYRHYQCMYKANKIYIEKQKEVYKKRLVEVLRTGTNPYNIFVPKK